MDTDSLIAEYEVKEELSDVEKTCGINLQQETFTPKTLILHAKSEGGKFRIHNQDAVAFDKILSKIITNKKDEYDDGYSTDIDINLIVKLNGEYFEEYLDSLTPNEFLKRASSGIFSSVKDYDDKPDFTAKSYKNIDSTLEAKNCINMNHFSTLRLHDAKYVFINSREEHKLRLLCNLQKTDDPTKLEIYENRGRTFKVINEDKPWFWLKKVYDNYDNARLDYSWQINRGIDDIGKYIEFVSPKLSTSKHIKEIK